MATVAADRHLLFGLLALQNGLIDQGQLMLAFQAWTRDKSKNLGDHLEARGDLTAAKRALLDALAEVHLEAHGGDVEKSLAAVPANRSTRASLAELGEPEIEQMLARIARRKNSHATEADDDADPDSTASLSVGSATSDGQRFRVLRPHARGGLGAVFVAFDCELHREVALKQIHEEHADDPDSRQRFIAEAEITGGLEHPGVVPVYGLGADARGRPYYAMRFIKGDSLKAAVARFHGDRSLKQDPGRRSLELRKLLRRFTDVCNAADYAHSRGVIHRDLKPANIIVGKHGETLLVDWGLAKSVGRVDRSVGEETIAPTSSGSSETQPGSALGTPAYMSPEQARGELNTLGPRSDVYSLGATLYCLLTGKPPFEAEDIGSVLHAVEEGQFSRPTQLDLAIDKALEAVCLKAMATAPEDRYPTPKALADDLDRWMADEPVNAWSEPLSRRAGRWGRRNRTWVTGAAVALLAGIIGLCTVLAVQTRANTWLKHANANLVAANERERAQFNLAMDAFKLFHSEVSEDLLLKEKQFEKPRIRLLHGAADFYGKLEDLLHGRTDRPSRVALGTAYERLGELIDVIGSKIEALALQRKSLTVRRVLADDPQADTATRADLARSLLAVGSLEQATGELAEAYVSFQEAQQLAAELATTAGPTDSVPEVLALSLRRIGELQAQTGKPDEALQSLERALVIQQKLADAKPDVPQFLSDVASIHDKIGWLLRQSGRPAEALASYEQASAILQKLADADPSVTQFQSNLARTYNDIGRLMYQTGRPVEALAACARASVIFQNLVDTNASVTQFQSDLAECQNTTAWLLKRNGKLTEALHEFERELAIRQKLVDANPSVTQFQSDLATSYSDICTLLRSAGNPAEALSASARALAIQQKLVDTNPSVTQFQSNLANTYLNIGALRQNARQTAEAVASFRQAIATYERLRTQRVFDMYNCACAYSLLSGVAVERGSGMTAAEGPPMGDRAMQWLRRAIAAGYGNIANMRTDSDLDPLRSRSDFQLLLMDLPFPADPFASGK
jgi:serine/threonine-protein kinase